MKPKLVCSYCQREKQGDKCRGCDSEIFEKPKQQSDTGRRQPFSYNGYMVFIERDDFSTIYTVHFYLGRELIETIVADRYSLLNLAENEWEIMPVIWKLFCMAQNGTKAKIVQKDEARFRIERIHDEDKKYWSVGQ